MAEVFSTNFAGYADGDLSANADWEKHNTSSITGWVYLSGAGVISNSASSQRANVQLVSGLAHADNQYCEVTLAQVTADSGRNIGLGLRMQPSNASTEDMYRLVIEPIGAGSSTECRIALAKYVAGASTNLANSETQNSQTFTIADGQVIRFEAEGTTLRGFVDGVEFVTATDSSFSGGQPGVHAFTPSGVDYSTFASGDLATGPSLTITDPIVPGSTTTFSTSGFVDPLTGVRITDAQGNVKELTLASQTSVSAPAVGDLDYALFGDLTLEVYNATESATATIAFNPPAGFDQIALEAGFATDINSFLYQYGGTPAVPDQFTYDPVSSGTAEVLTLQTNGYWTATGYGEWTIYGIDATDGEMQSFPFVWDAPVIPGGSGKMTRRNVTLRAVTRRTLTARP